MTTTIRSTQSLAEFLNSTDLSSLRGLTVVLDLDNTTLKYNAALGTYVFVTEGRRVPVSCPSYSFADSQWFTSTEDFLATHVRAVEDGLFATMEAYAGAAETVAALRAAGVYVKVATYRFITGGEDLVRETTLTGLARAGIEYDELHFVKNKYEISGDVYLDDAPYVIEALDERGLNRIVFDQQYNQQFAGPRVTSWADVPAMLATFLEVKAA